MSNSGKHKITERIYYAVCLKLLSPLSIAGGDSEVTDSDVILDGKGHPFIPGTSMAGAFRNYLGMKKEESSMLGYSQGENGRMSQLFIQDVYLKDGKKSIRDGVKLNEGKTVEPEGKFDMEIVETGATGQLFMELTVRDGLEDAEKLTKQINTVLCNLQSGEIRIGANKNRGFGRITITEIYEKHFKKDNREEWLDFLEDTREGVEKYREENQKVSFEEWKNEKELEESSKYLKITVPLKLNGGISIRKYSTRPGEADYEHITCNDEPVIPGSSWNGAIRSRMLSMLRDLGMLEKAAGNCMDAWFGYVDKEKKDRAKARQSYVVIGESIIEGATELPMTRTRINRFDASAAGLYQEISYFGGTTRLEIMVRKDIPEKEAFLTLLDFVIKDIQNGYLAVGGQTAVGRGLFQESGIVDYSDVDARSDAALDFRAYKASLFQLIESVKKTS